jgi:hypothetical protein
MGSMCSSGCAVTCKAASQQVLQGMFHSGTHCIITVSLSYCAITDRQYSSFNVFVLVLYRLKITSYGLPKHACRHEGFLLCLTNAQGSSWEVRFLGGQVGGHGPWAEIGS